MGGLSPQEALRHVAYSAVCRHTADQLSYVQKGQLGRYTFTTKQETTLADLEHLVNAAKKRIADAQPREARVDQAALHVLANCLEQKSSTKGVSGMWRRLCADSSCLTRLKQLVRVIRTSIPPISLDRISSEKEAFTTFYGRFEQLLGRRPNLPKSHEYFLVREVSQRIWCCSREAYQNYEKLMTEFFLGSHFVLPYIDETEEIWNRLVHAKNVRICTSSHYNSWWEGTHHYRLAGSQIAEILFGREELAEKVEPDGSTSLVGGIPYRALPQELRKHTRAREVMWIQLEKTADGVTLLSRLRHWFVDFPTYFLRRYLFAQERAQVGPFRGPEGCGLTDAYPIVLDRK